MGNQEKLTRKEKLQINYLAKKKKKLENFRLERSKKFKEQFSCHYPDRQK